MIPQLFSSTKIAICIAEIKKTNTIYGKNHTFRLPLYCSHNANTRLHRNDILYIYLVDPSLQYKTIFSKRRITAVRRRIHKKDTPVLLNDTTPSSPYKSLFSTRNIPPVSSDTKRHHPISPIQIVMFGGKDTTQFLQQYDTKSCQSIKLCRHMYSEGQKTFAIMSENTTQKVANEVKLCGPISSEQ